MTDKLVTVTGAAGYTGRYIARSLLDLGCPVQSITGHPERPDPFAGQVPFFPFSFDDPTALTERLRGTDTLVNTYWIRVNYRNRTHAQCVAQTRAMFDCARAAGVRRIVHISITNPDANSDLPYFRGKGQLEDYLRELDGVSYAILRPTVLYSLEDILLNNIAWSVRNFPVFLLPGNGRYPLQPVHVADLAALAVEAIGSDDNRVIDAVGPEIYTFRELVNLVTRHAGTFCKAVPVPALAAYLAGRALGVALRDIVLTRDEISGLSRGLLVSSLGHPAPCPTRLSEWLEQYGRDLGQRYANEIRRHYR